MSSEREITIAGRRIGAGAACYVIAEIGINHNGSLDVARRLIDAAADAGTDAVKFQRRTLGDTYRAESLAKPRQGTPRTLNRSYILAALLTE